MISKSFIELTKCRLREFIREPSAAFFVFSMPILWMVLLGLAFSSDKKEFISVGITTEKHTSLSEEKNLLLSALAEKENFKVKEMDKEKLFKLLRQNEVSLILDFSEANVLNYAYDSTNPKSLLHKLKINTLLQEKLGRQDILKAKDSVYTPAGSRYIDFLIPGLLAFSLLTTSLFGTGMIIVVSRREKLLQRFLVTPMKPLEYFLSHMASRMMIVFLEVCVILLAGFLLFGFTVKGSLLSYFALSFLGGLCFTSLAIFCSSKGKNSSAYSGFANLIVVILMIISGIWFNRNNFPLWLQELSRYSPLSALVDGLRRIALEGESLFHLGPESFLIFLYTVFFLAMSKKYFKWL